MPLLERIAKERASHAVPLPNWLDAIGDAVEPKEVYWTFTDLHGNVINSRKDVLVDPECEPLILLEEDDLVIEEEEQYKDYVTRILSIAAKYTNSLGSDLWTREEYRLRIAPLKNVT